MNLYFTSKSVSKNRLLSKSYYLLYIIGVSVIRNNLSF